SSRRRHTIFKCDWSSDVCSSDLDPMGTIDLAAAIDSAFKVVETSNPECITETSRWRGQKAWINLVNKAIERLNTDDPDSAEASEIGRASCRERVRGGGGEGGGNK